MYDFMMLFMRKHMDFFTLILFTFQGLVACASQSASQTELPLDTPGNLAEWTPIPSVTATVQPAATTPAPITTITPAPIANLAEIVTLCSPLTEHTIEELFEIISDPYQPPPMGSDARHHGVDFSYYQYGDRPSIEGMVVQAIFPGIVVASVSNQIPYGNMIMIAVPITDLPNHIFSGLGYQPGEVLYVLYAHLLANPDLRVGDQVASCAALGNVGRSGGGEGFDYIIPHLHLETRFGPAGVVFPEMAYYDTRASQEARDNYTRWRMSGEFRHFDPMELFSNQQDLGVLSPTP